MPVEFLTDDEDYVRPETLTGANAPLVARQAVLPLAQAWGGGLVAAVDGMRFVVPVPAAFARPNRKYFGSKRGMTWLNAMNDRGMGRGAKVVSGTVRDSLHMVDVIFGLDGGELPEIVVSDTGSYSDWCSACWSCSGSPTGPRWPTCPTKRAGGSARPLTTAR
jgi:TnpA family transposase